MHPTRNALLILAMRWRLPGVDLVCDIQQGIACWMDFTISVIRDADLFTVMLYCARWFPVLANCHCPAGQDHQENCAAFSLQCLQDSTHARAQGVPWLLPCHPFRLQPLRTYLMSQARCANPACAVGLCCLWSCL